MPCWAQSPFRQPTKNQMEGKACIPYAIFLLVVAIFILLDARNSLRMATNSACIHNIQWNVCASQSPCNPITAKWSSPARIIGDLSLFFSFSDFLFFFCPAPTTALLYTRLIYSSTDRMTFLHCYCPTMFRPAMILATTTTSTLLSAIFAIRNWQDNNNNKNVEIAQTWPPCDVWHLNSSFSPCTLIRCYLLSPGDACWFDCSCILSRFCVTQNVWFQAYVE